MNPAALVTGASRGIGRGIALELAQAGFDLALNYAGNREAAEQTRRDCVEAARENAKNIRAEICQADISNTTDRQRLVQFTRDTFKRLDLLVNNAGLAPTVRADILEASEESFDLLINVNLKGPYFLTQAVANWMIEQTRQGVYKGAPTRHRPTVATIAYPRRVWPCSRGFTRPAWPSTASWYTRYGLA